MDTDEIKRLHTLVKGSVGGLLADPAIDEVKLVIVSGGQKIASWTHSDDVEPVLSRST